MAKRGRPKTPLKLLKARGSRVVKKREEVERAKGDTPDYKRPRPPRWLGHTGKSEWRRLIPILESWGLISQLDRDVLARYCAEVVMYERLEREVSSMDTDDLVIESRTGSKYLAPILGARNASAKRLLALEGVLGLTPLAREGLIVKPKKTEPKSDKDRFFDKKFGNEPDKTA